MFTVTITEDGNVTKRTADSLDVAIVSAVLAHKDMIAGDLAGVFQVLAQATRDVFDYADWDSDAKKEEMELGAALWNLLHKRAVPGFTGPISSAEE